MDGPPALRDEWNVMGFAYLRGANAVRVRQGNKMALRSVKRCSQLHAQGRFFSLEHPWRSWLWYMQPVINLAAEEGVFMAVFSNCCHGGRREKWTALLTNSKEVYDAMHKENCEHAHEQADYQPYYDEDSRDVCQDGTGSSPAAVKSRDFSRHPGGATSDAAVRPAGEISQNE